ncbi:MAG: sodium:alanine symporter family protein [Simkania sp.]|nr:sodium:alanine symporter family protein [Simkania sp.]
MFAKELLSAFNHSITLFAIFPAIICIGLYLTFKLRCIQISHLKRSFEYLTKKDTNEGSISRFGAISAVLSGNFGTGNISGMAIALSTGGPGALVWMWIMVFLGSAIQYASCVLGVKFRIKTDKNEYVGGPMYYLRDGLGYRNMAILFSLFTIFGAISVGNFAQINSIMLPLQKMGWNPLYCAIGIAGMVALVTLGGIQRLASFSSIIVPFKAALYLGTGCIVIALNYDKVLPAFQIMFQHAFDFSSMAGGVMGAGVLRAMTTGFDRGLFATDAGTGIVPIMQASARSAHPVVDGIATLVAPLMVMIVCTTTGLILIVTDAWLEPNLQSTNMVIHAFSHGLGSPVGGYIVIAALILFAYTTILAWSYCGEKALEFLVGPERARWFRYVFVTLVPVASFLQMDVIWSLADTAISCMLLTNLVGITLLSKGVIESSRQFKLSDQKAKLSC